MRGGDQHGAGKGTVQSNTWTWLSEYKIGSKVIKRRFIYKEVSADTATMKGELQGDDGRWNLLMEMKARRVKQLEAADSGCYLT